MKRIGLLWFWSGLVLAMGTPPPPASKPVQPAPAGAAAVMLRDDELRASPDVSGRVLGRLAKGMAVRTLASQGGWTQVAGTGQTGWVRVLSVRSAQAGQAGADLAGMVEATSPRGPGQVVSVAGLRGLSEETLRSAAFNPAELRLLDGYAMGRAEAEQFARASGLAPRDLPYLAAPREPGAPANDSPWKDIEP
jgi:hypothetical protein